MEGPHSNHPSVGVLIPGRATPVKIALSFKTDFAGFVTAIGFIVCVVAPGLVTGISPLFPVGWLEVPVEPDEPVEPEPVPVEPDVGFGPVLKFNVLP